MSTSPARSGDGRMQQLTILICEQDRWHHRPLYLAILELVRARGGAGASVFKGLAGYSAGSRTIHTGNLVDVAAALPLMIVVVDEAARIAALRPELEEMIAVNGGLLTVVDVVGHEYRHPSRQHGGHPQLKVHDIMESQVRAVRPETPVAEVLPLLLNQFYKALPVVDDADRVLGMVTDVDLLEKANLGLRLSVLEAVLDEGEQGFDDVVRALRAGGKTVRDVMGVRPEAVIGPDASVAEAARCMVEQHVKRLPVVDRERRLLGIVGRLDILKAASDVWPGSSGPELQGTVPADARTVGEVMLREVPTVEGDTPLARVMDLLVGSTGARRVVVLDNAANRLVVGVITDADLVQRVAQQARPSLLRGLREGLAALGLSGEDQTRAAIQGRTAREIMTAPVITVPATTPITAAIRVMVDHGVKVLPVTDAAGRLVGVVNRARLLQALLRHLDQMPPGAGAAGAPAEGAGPA